MEFPRGHERLGIPAAVLIRPVARKRGGRRKLAITKVARSLAAGETTFVSSIKYIAIFKIKKGPPLPGGLLSIADFATAR